MKMLLVDFGMPFDGQTPYNSPLGGSETSLLLLAKGLAALNHQVVCLNTANWSAQNEPNLTFGPVAAFNQVAPDADAIVLNRHIPQEVLGQLGKKPVYYWSHDAYDQENVKWMMNKEAQESPIHVLCVSEWQKKTFSSYLGFPEEKMSVLPNCIDRSCYTGLNVKRNLNKLIFASIPYKGIDVLKRIFDDVCTRTFSETPPELHIFSSMNLYGRPDGDREYEQAFNELINTNGIYLHNPISMSDLAREFASSSILLAPCTYHETFGRVFIEAMAAGCIPVAVDNGANSEVLKNHGKVVAGSNIKNLDVHNAFVDTIVSSMLSMKRSDREAAKEYALKYDHIKIANKFMRMLKE